ncbi:MAG: CHASE3 domain-containing protein [Bradyrhizobium sp.]|uniref:CHASE3 domain-containing protein n=1 Tax=Bradyrhizobium sp. TaxID=376 RepID=UPI003C79BF9F
MIRQRWTIGLGLGILLAIGAAATALDIKSRHDAGWVEHTLEVLQKISELRLRLRQVESASRGFALTRSPDFVAEFEDARKNIPAVATDLQRAVQDNPAQLTRLAKIRDLIARRIAASGELVRLSTASDGAGLAALQAKPEGRASQTEIAGQLDAFATEEKRLLDERTATSRANGALLLAVNLAGLALLLMIAAYLIRRAYLADRALRSSLSRSETEASTLEAQAVEQMQHLDVAHQEARHSASILNNTFNTMAEGVLVIDQSGAIVLSNPAAARIFQLKADTTLFDIKDQNRFFEHDGTTLIPDFELPTARALRGLPFDRREIIVRHNNRRGSFSLMVSGRPLRSRAGEITSAAMVYHDITDTLETERLLQQAQKLDAIGKLTGGVAHDFNNMLTIITGSIETLIDDIQDRPAAVELAVLIGRAADRCTELIRHLLAFARKQPLRPRDIDVNATVLDMSKLLRPTLGEQIEIHTILDDDRLIAHVDSAQLANSLVNLAINARDAMPNGGKLLLESSLAVLDETYAAANPGVTPGGYIMVAVSDTGSGMPAEIRDHAFEPFFTTKEAGKGSGLGLSMVYGFAKQSGGHVKIYSEEDHGTTVRLYLPPARADAQIAPVTHGPMPFGTETILVVEDDPLVHDFVLAQLRSLGYSTIAVTSGAAALAVVTSGRAFDLLFTDVIMPGGMTGKELAEQVLRLRPRTRVLYTSGYTDNAMLAHGRLDHGALLLAKPYRRSELAQMIRAALDAPINVPIPAPQD